CAGAAAAAMAVGRGRRGLGGRATRVGAGRPTVGGGPVGLSGAEGRRTDGGRDVEVDGRHDVGGESGLLEATHPARTGVTPMRATAGICVFLALNRVRGFGAPGKPEIVAVHRAVHQQVGCIRPHERTTRAVRALVLEEWAVVSEDL